MNENDNTQPTRRERFGKWLNRNAEEVVAGTFYTAIIGGTVALFVYAAKQENKAMAEYKEESQRRHEVQEGLKHDALERGAQVLPTGTGEYWVIENGQTSLI